MTATAAVLPVTGIVPRPSPGRINAPSTPLGQARMAQGWSMQRAVRAVLSLAHAWGWTQVPGDESMTRQMRRWESGHTPGADYRKLLAAAYQTTEHALGWESLSERPATVRQVPMGVPTRIARQVLAHAEAVDLSSTDVCELALHLGALKTSLRSLLESVDPQLAESAL